MSRKQTGEEVTSVRTLSVTQFDRDREFAGISNMKIDKKDRHMKRLYEFSKFLERTNEEVVQDVLRFSRNNRETLEVMDEDLQKFYQQLDDNNFLIDKKERDLLNNLELLKSKLKKRSDMIMQFAFDLDATELKRSEMTGKELKVIIIILCRHYLIK